MSTWVVVGVLALLLLGGGGVAVYVMARGIRNNNPLNIRRSSDQWQGLAPEQTDDAFFQFISPAYGIRAATIILHNYRARYGLVTLRQWLTRWAPPSENDTESYIRTVSAASGVAPDDVVSDDQIPLVISGMVRQENGFNPYQLAEIESGVALA